MIDGANGKLKQYAEQLNTYDDNNKEKYKATKNMSIEVVQDYLRTNDLAFLKDHLEKFSKKDDLCDSLLQGFYWIDKVSEEENKKQKKAAIKEAKKSKTKKSKAIIDNNVQSDLMIEANKIVNETTTVKTKRNKKHEILEI